MATIRLVAVTKEFNKKKILNEISLEVPNGEFLSLLGPSGVGKTTLLKVIAGLEEPTSGKVFFDGVDVTSVPSRLRDAIIVFQDHSLFPHLTAYENIAFGLRARRESRQSIARKVDNMLELVRLSDKGQRYPHELSGGEKQRVALARACVLEPKVLLLDEPFSNLDINLRLSMRDFMVDLQRRLKFTCLLVTHDKGEAFAMTERIAVMLNGRLEQVDIPEVLYDSPRSHRVASFLGDFNFVPGFVQDGFFTCAFGSFLTSTPDAGRAVGMWRHDQVAIGRTQGEVPGLIVAKTFGGQSTHYRVALKDGVHLTVTCGHGKFSINEDVFVSLDESSLRVYVL